MNEPQMLLTRFAPSPTGELHLGHAVHIMHVFGVARALNARVQLRFEDHDGLRCRSEYADSIKGDLQWLGFIRGDETWSVQSSRRGEYEGFLKHLHDRGLIYGCCCSRKEIQERQTNGSPTTAGEIPYDGHCRDRNLPVFESGLTVRLRVDAEGTDPARPKGNPIKDLQVSETANDIRLGRIQQTPALQCGDFPLRDNKGFFTYQFCVVVDDFLEKINLIIRGEDLLPSTGRQVYLLRLLGGRTPLYLHHSLLFGTQGEKLSKAYRSLTLRQLRENGLTPHQVLGLAAHKTGLISRERPVCFDEVEGLFPILKQDRQILAEIGRGYRLSE